MKEPAHRRRPAAGHGGHDAGRTSLGLGRRWRSPPGPWRLADREHRGGLHPAGDARATGIHGRSRRVRHRRLAVDHLSPV